MTPQSHSIAHVPWSDDEAAQQLRLADAEAHALSRSSRFKTNLGWFFATAIAANALLTLDQPQTEGWFYASILVAAGLAYVSAIWGFNARDTLWLVEDWKLRAGYSPLTASEVADLRLRAIAVPDAASVLSRWVNAGHHLRERDRRHIESLLAKAGIASPRRPGSMQDLIAGVTE